MLEEFENWEDRLSTLSDSVYIFWLLNRRNICFNALAIVLLLGNLLRILQILGLNGVVASAQVLWYRVNLLTEGLRTTGGKDVCIRRLLRPWTWHDLGAVTRILSSMLSSGLQNEAAAHLTHARHFFNNFHFPHHVILISSPMDYFWLGHLLFLVNYRWHLILLA